MELHFRWLGLAPMLGLGAALSWVVFLHMEATGMIVMSIMKELWQSEARAQGRFEAQMEAHADAREARLEAREARLKEREAQAIIHDLRRQLREARGEGADVGVDDA